MLYCDDLVFVSLSVYLCFSFLQLNTKRITKLIKIMTVIIWFSLTRFKAIFSSRHHPGYTANKYTKIVDEKVKEMKI